MRTLTSRDLKNNPAILASWGDYGRHLQVEGNALCLPLSEGKDAVPLGEAILRSRAQRALERFRVKAPESGLAREDVEAVLDVVRFGADWISPIPLMGSLPDEADRPFIEVALTASVPLVTGNSTHFPQIEGLAVIRPS